MSRVLALSMMAAFLGGISQSVSQNLGRTLEAIAISNAINALALGLAFWAGLEYNAPTGKHS
jgi:hypothetical protein